MDNREVLDQIQRGYRMPRHENCPEKISDSMLRCWDSSLDNRPTFDVNETKFFFSIYIYSSMITLRVLVLNIIAKMNSLPMLLSSFFSQNKSNAGFFFHYSE